MAAMKFGTALILVTSLLGCTGVPKGLTPVSGFDVKKYLGTWYEIARLDHPFEKGLSNVSAVYTQRADGVIGVLNKGFDGQNDRWTDAEGRARFLGDESVGSLKVSFFGPFYGGYHIIALDRKHYRYAMVAGPTRSYLWILSRSKTMDESVYQDLISRAGAWGFDTKKLIRVEHDL